MILTVGIRTWPENWADSRAGLNCPTCQQGRPDETKGGLRFYGGAVADVYLRKRAPLPGYSMRSGAAATYLIS